MLRRVSMEFYFTAEQVVKILSILPGESRVDAIVTMFGRTIDVEKLQWHTLTTDAQYVALKRRLGAANLFNAFRPEGKYRLTLSNDDERLVMRMLVAPPYDG